MGQRRTAQRGQIYGYQIFEAKIHTPKALAMVQKFSLNLSGLSSPSVVYTVYGAPNEFTHRPVLYPSGDILPYCSKRGSQTSSGMSAGGSLEMQLQPRHIESELVF